MPSKLKATDLVTSEFVQATRLGVCIRTPLENVTHFKAESKYVTAFTKANGEFTLDIPLWDIETTICHLATVTHRSYLVMDHALKGAKMFKPAGAAVWELEVINTLAHGPHRALCPRIIRVARREAKRVRALWVAINA